MIKSRRWNSLPLRFKLFWSAFGLCGFFLVMQSIIYYQTFYRAVGKITEQWDEDSLLYVRSGMESEIQDMAQYTLKVSDNERLIGLLEQWSGVERLTYRQIELEDNILNQLNMLIAGYDGIFNMAVYTYDEKKFVSNKQINMPQWDRQTMLEYVSKVKTSPDGVIMDETFNEDELAQILFITTIETSDDEPLLLALLMKHSWISEIVGNNVLLSVYNDDSGHYLYTPDEKEWLDYHKSSLVFEKEVESVGIGGKYRVASVSAPEYGWTYTLYSDISQSTTHLHRIIWFAVADIVLCIILAALCSRLLMGKVMEPVDILMQSFDTNTINEQPVQVTYHKRRKKFSDMLMLYFFASCVFPILISTISYYGIVNMVLKNTLKESITQYMEQAKNSADVFLNRAKRTALTIAIDPNVQQFMQGAVNDTPVTVEQLNVFLQTAAGACQSLEQQTDVQLYDGTGEIVASVLWNEQKMSEPVLRYFIDTNYPFYVVKIQDENLKIYKNIRSALPETIYSLLGYICLDISFNEFQSSFIGRAIENLDTLVLDNTGQPINSYGTEWIPSDMVKLLISESTSTPSLVEEKGVLYGCIMIEQQDWLIFCEIPMDELLSSRYELIISSVFIMLLMLCIILWIGHGLSGRFSRSVEILQYNLLKWSKDEEQDNFAAGVQDNEISRIASTFNVMAGRIKQLLTETYQSKINEMQLENEYRKAELLALQSQINPHFLYNTFESLKYMVREQKTEDAVNMIDMLGDIFRAAADDRNNLISLCEELEYAKAYMALQSIRYEKKIDIRFDISNEAADVLIPKLALQPLLENAIIHGKREKNGVLFINVSTKMDDNTLVMTIANDGEIPESKLKKLREEMNSDEAGDSSIGLLNVNRRIKLYFGPEYGADIENTIECGIVVTLRLPLNEENTEAGNV